MSMRICHIINDVGPGFGGAEVLVDRLSLGLNSKEGIESDVYTLRDPKESKIKAGLYDFRRWISIYRNISSYDIIHSHLFPSIFMTAIYKAIQPGSKLVLTEHNTQNRRRRSALGRSLDKFIYGSADAIVCISSGTKDEFLKCYPRFSGITHTVYNGVNVIDAPVERRAIGTVLNLIAIGRLVEQKGFDIAIRALPILPPRSVQLTILGEGPERAALEALASELGVSSAVRMPGYVENIGSFLGDADLAIMPSRYEGFGLAAVEAMSAGLPIIAANVSGLREVASISFPGAILIPPNDEAQLAEAIMRYCEKGLRREGGMMAQNHAKRFSLDAMIDGYLHIYRNICK